MYSVKRGKLYRQRRAGGIRARTNENQTDIWQIIIGAGRGRSWYKLYYSASKEKPYRGFIETTCADLHICGVYRHLMRGAAKRNSDSFSLHRVSPPATIYLPVTGYSVLLFLVIQPRFFPRKEQAASYYIITEKDLSPIKHIFKTIFVSSRYNAIPNDAGIHIPIE